MEEYLTQILTRLIAEHPIVSGFVAVLGVMRLLVVPLQTIVMTIVGATPTPRDDEIAEDFFNGRIWKSLVAALEWVSSLNLRRY